MQLQILPLVRASLLLGLSRTLCTITVDEMGRVGNDEAGLVLVLGWVGLLGVEAGGLLTGDDGGGEEVVRAGVALLRLLAHFDRFPRDLQVGLCDA